MNTQQQLALAAASGGGANPLAVLNPFAPCQAAASAITAPCQADSMAEDMKVDAIANIVEQPKTLSGGGGNKKHFLRICIHSAKSLTADMAG